MKRYIVIGGVMVLCLAIILIPEFFNKSGNTDTLLPPLDEEIIVTAKVFQQDDLLNEENAFTHAEYGYSGKIKIVCGEFCRLHVNNKPFGDEFPGPIFPSIREEWIGHSRYDRRTPREERIPEQDLIFLTIEGPFAQSAHYPCEGWGYVFRNEKNKRLKLLTRFTTFRRPLDDRGCSNFYGACKIVSDPDTGEFGYDLYSMVIPTLYCGGESGRFFHR